MPFLAALSKFTPDAAKWAAGQKDDAAAWLVCPDARWLMWYCETIGIDGALLGQAMTACLGDPDAKSNARVLAVKGDERKFTRTIFVHELARTGDDAVKLLADLCDKLRGIVSWETVQAAEKG